MTPAEADRREPTWLQLACQGCFLLAIITSWVWFILHQVSSGSWHQSRAIDGSPASAVGVVGVAAIALWAIAFVVRIYQFTHERRAD